jgi:Bacterial PH domain
VPPVPAFGGPLPGTQRPWKVTADGRTVFRRATPLILWWAWVAFAIFNLVQVIVPDHDYFSIELVAGLLAVTGVAYATTLRPRVIADEDGILVRNPLRDHLIGWGGVNGVYLGDSVELSCARPEPRKDKTVYCWALYTNRRRRTKSQQLGVRSWTRPASRAAAAGEVPAEDAGHLMATELGRLSAEAREAGAPAAIVESRWAWLPVALILIPAAALLALALAA